ncbi:hypothetical protein [Sphingobacterium pedocola]|uniref:Uncharacterized protein n=1 Tax=Sphingobacterium pedocola TaxID=2082722 RepID=A0ABR9TAD1_9SPHI|nr:hypothetical protein [Sphingobacterium pedocola]MBE8722310.1 hypothetical protein [Sphingobacterium pedocola]
MVDTEKEGAWLGLSSAAHTIARIVRDITLPNGRRGSTIEADGDYTLRNSLERKRFMMDFLLFDRGGVAKGYFKG